MGPAVVVSWATFFWPSFKRRSCFFFSFFTVYTVLLHLKEKMPLGEFFMAIRNIPTAHALFLQVKCCIALFCYFTSPLIVPVNGCSVRILGMFCDGMGQSKWFSIKYNHLIRNHIQSRYFLPHLYFFLCSKHSNK